MDFSPALPTAAVQMHIPAKFRLVIFGVEPIAMSSSSNRDANSTLVTRHSSLVTRYFPFATNHCLLSRRLHAAFFSFSQRPKPHPSFRTQQADFFFPLRSREAVGLRSEKSLFAFLRVDI